MAHYLATCLGNGDMCLTTLSVYKGRFANRPYENFSEQGGGSLLVELQILGSEMVEDLNE